jgi:hypothetical protein
MTSGCLQKEFLVRRRQREHTGGTDNIDGHRMY